MIVWFLYLSDISSAVTSVATFTSVATSGAASGRATSELAASATTVSTSGAASEATSGASSGATSEIGSSGAGEVNSDVSAIEFLSGQFNSLFSSFGGAEFDVSETSWLAIFTSGDSDVGDITDASEQLSKAGFSGGVAEVSDEDLSGGFSLLSVGAAVSSFLFRSGLFDGQRSAFEFVAVEGQSLVEAIGVGELDEGDTLGSAVGASKDVNLLDSSA